MGKRMLIFILAFFLGTASLASVSATDVHAESQKSIYVIKSINNEFISPAIKTDKVIRETAYSSTEKIDVKYNKKGLVSSEKYNYDRFINNHKYTYDKKNRYKTTTYKAKTGNTVTDTFSYDKKGRVKLVKSGWGGQASLKYNKKSYCTFNGYDVTFKFDSKGRVTSKSGPDQKTSFKYDSKGGWKSIVKTTSTTLGDSFVTRYTCKNTYKSGRIVKQVITSQDGEVLTRTFKYKKVKVPASLAKRVKAQQRYLNYNGFAVPIISEEYSLRLESFYK